MPWNREVLGLQLSKLLYNSLQNFQSAGCAGFCRGIHGLYKDNDVNRKSLAYSLAVILLGGSNDAEFYGAPARKIRIIRTC